MTTINQANQYFQQGDFKQAEALYRQLLQKNPHDINALWGLGKVALGFDNYQAACDIFKQCVSLFSQEPRLWLSLAQACQKLTNFDQGEHALIKAYELNKEYLPSLLALAIFYCESGEFDRAESYLAQILAIKPEHVRAFCLLVRIKRINLLNPLSQLLLSQLSSAKTQLSNTNVILLHYAFFALFQQAKEYKQALEHVEKANAAQYALTDFTVDDMQPFFNDLISSFDEKSFLKHQHSTENSENSELVPIFIVGQPRSGSTLLEQMLIGHQEISSAGELPFLAGDIAQGVFQLTGKHFPQGCSHLSAQQCQTLGQHYLKSMQSIAPNAKYIIDKMPANYQSIGLIKMLIPQAKVIHITRDPIDVSWSIYQNNFESPEPYFCSLSGIIKYNSYYQQVMSHWQKFIPDFVCTIEYSKLVSNPTEELSKVLAFCGLAFESECLTFSEKNRHISTLSDIQLRSGMNKIQTGAHLPYQELLPQIWQDFVTDLRA